MVNTFAVNGERNGKQIASKVHRKCVQMHICPFTKLGCNPCFTKELQPNRLYIKHLRFILPLLLVPQKNIA